jgi:hypothetical protein
VTIGARNLTASRQDIVLFAPLQRELAHAEVRSHLYIAACELEGITTCIFNRQKEAE